MESYYARALQGQLSSEPLPRLLEIADIISGDDGEAYAHQLKSILRAVEGNEPLNKRPVLQDAVEELLIRIHTGKCLAQTPLASSSFLLQGTVRGEVDALACCSPLLWITTQRLDLLSW